MMCEKLFPSRRYLLAGAGPSKSDWLKLTDEANLEKTLAEKGNTVILNEEQANMAGPRRNRAR